MLSRVANDIYWMNRYIERAENYARFLDVNFNLSLDMPSDISEQWEPLVVTTGDIKLFKSSYDKASKGNVILFLGFDPENPNSIHSSIRNAREIARAVRPDITKEVWEQINKLYYFVKNGYELKRWQKKDIRDYFREIKNGCQLLYGIFDATISRTEGWHFGKIGQLIERSDKTSRVLDVKYHMLLPSAEAVGSPVDLIQWASLLRSVSAYDMYLKQNGKLAPWTIAEFLILDKIFPRAILRCLSEAEHSLIQITGNFEGYTTTAEKKLGLLKSQLEYCEINEILEEGLHQYIDNFQGKLNGVSNAIFETFFK